MELNSQHLLGSSEIISPFTEPMTSNSIFDTPVPSASSLFGVFQILLNTAIGSGTLMVPYTYTCGMGLSLLISVLFASLAYAAMHFMIDASQVARKYDYHALFTHCFGEKWVWVLNVMITLVQFGGMMIYAHWNGKLLNTLIDCGGIPLLESTPFWIALVTTLIVFPLTIFRSIAQLEKFAMLSTCFIIMLIAHAVYWFFVGLDDPTFVEKQSQFKLFDFSQWKVIIAAFGVNSMAFNCHINLFPCLENLKDCTLKRARTLGIMTIAAAFVLYHIFGSFTYLHLYDDLSTHQSALEYYPTDNYFTLIVTIGVILILVISSPIVCWAARNSINTLFWKDKPMTETRWVSIGGGLCLLASFLASTSDNVLLFFDLVGGLFTPIIILLLPALFFLRLCLDAPWYMKIISYITAGFTVIGAAACTYQAIDEIIGLVNGEGH